METKAQFLLELNYLEPQVFEWCEGVFICEKEDLKTCKIWAQREFGYGTPIVSFILERVPMMRP